MPRLSLCALVRRASFIVPLLLLLGAQGSARAQLAAADLPQADLPHLKWWHGLVAVGGYALFTTLDDEVQGFVRSNRSATSDGVAHFTRRMGQPEIYATAGLGIIATGLITGDRGIRDAGIRVSTSLAMTGVVVTVAKFTAGRARPSRAGSDGDDFSPFSGNTSAPSGHSAMAFALATSLGDEIGNRWVSAGLYTLAAGTAWSRVNDDAHWLSDVVTGAAVGIVSARFINGKLKLFGIKPPALRPTPSGVTISWSETF